MWQRLKGRYDAMRETYEDFDEELQRPLKILAWMFVIGNFTNFALLPIVLLLGWQSNIVVACVMLVFSTNPIVLVAVSGANPVWLLITVHIVRRLSTSVFHYELGDHGYEEFKESSIGGWIRERLERRALTRWIVTLFFWIARRLDELAHHFERFLQEHGLRRVALVLSWIVRFVGLAAVVATNWGTGRAINGAGAHSDNFPPRFTAVAVTTGTILGALFFGLGFQ